MQRKRLVQVVVIVLALVFFEWVVGKWADFMWFSSLEYDRVFLETFFDSLCCRGCHFSCLFCLISGEFLVPAPFIAYIPGL
jgi:uncharacterized membrane protein (UPF0182 family)